MPLFNTFHCSRATCRWEMIRNGNGCFGCARRQVRILCKYNGRKVSGCFNCFIFYFQAFASLAANDEAIRKRIIETDTLMDRVVGGLIDPNEMVALAAVRCLHSLSRSVHQLRTTFKVRVENRTVQAEPYSHVYFTAYRLVQN